MIIQIEVQPATAALIEQAAAKGVSLDLVLRDALEDLEDKISEPDTISTSELDAQLDALADGSDNAPVLPEEANSRAFYYEDRI